MLNRIRTWYRHNILQIGGRIDSDVRGIYWKCACGCGKEIVTPWSEINPIIDKHLELAQKLRERGCTAPQAASIACKMIDDRTR